MSHIQNRIVASLAVIVLLTTSAAFAEGDVSTSSAQTDTVKSTQKKQPKKKLSKHASTSAAPKADASTPPSNASIPPTPLKTGLQAPPPTATFEASGEDSADEVRLRSGPGNPVLGRDKS
jgi:hypothetical protein